jgi:adenosine/AMP kinase
MAAPLELELVDIVNPKEYNFILGHSHFIRTVEDLAEVMATTAGQAAKWGIAFNEASGDPDNEKMPGAAGEGRVQ